MYYWLFWVVYLLIREHLSIGKYTFLHLSPYISLSLPTHSKSIIHFFKTLSFNVIFFLNSCFSILFHPRLPCPFLSAIILLTHPAPLPTLRSSFILTSRTFHLLPCVWKHLLFSTFLSQRDGHKETWTQHTHTQCHRNAHWHARTHT